MISKYGLNFISDENLYLHVKNTIEKYRFKINLKDFTKNLIDPIKLTFDCKIYRKSLEELIESEIIRQMDKSNTNHIGYFHQNIFQYIGENWEIPKIGFDIINTQQKIYVELKNKHNTMNSSSAQKTYMRMQHQILQDNDSQCFLVEVIAKNSQNNPWTVSLDGVSVLNNNIRRVSIDKFYEIVTGNSLAFRNLCQVLPKVIDDILKSTNEQFIENTVMNDLKKLNLNNNLLQEIYLFTFKHYEGFEQFQLK